MNFKIRSRFISAVTMLAAGCFFCCTIAWSATAFIADELKVAHGQGGRPVNSSIIMLLLLSDDGGDYGPHANLTFAEYPGNCLGCHQNQAAEVAGSTHFRWLGNAPDMVNGVGLQQGKLTNAVNSYCINILGNWPVCGSCHVGFGKPPDDPAAGYENIDCLMCHNEQYATQRVRLADGSMGVERPIDAMVRNVHRPKKANCLACHAKATTTCSAMTPAARWMSN